MPNNLPPVESARVVEVLQRFVAADPVPKALLVFVPADRSAELRKAVKVAGFEPVFAVNGKEAFERLHRAADIDVILIHYTAPDAELPYFLTQLRADSEVGLLPVLLIAPTDRLRPDDKGADILARRQFQNNLARLADGYRNVWVVPEAAAATPDQLKSRLEKYLRYAALPVTLGRASGDGSARLDQYARNVKALLSPAERKQFARESLYALWRMARGEVKGYDVRPAEAAVVGALRVDDLAERAVEVLGRLPGTESQQRLASLVLDPKRGKLRLTAAVELNRHAQKYGLVLPQTLDPDRLKQLRAIAENPAEDLALRTQVALLVGRMGVSARESGVRLYQFRPEAPAPKKN
jgi:CheY-like chemotaxis protein